MVASTNNPEATVRDRSTLKLSFGVSCVFATALLVAVFVTAQPAGAATAYTATSASGNWNDPTKWTPNGIPGSAAGDSVSILCCSINMNYAMPNDLAGFSNGATLTFNSGGTLRLGAGTNTNTGTMNVTAGSLVINSTTLNVNGTGPFTISDASVSASGGILACNSCSAMTIGGTNVSLSGLTLNNTGTIVYSTSGTLTLIGGTQINNNSGGVFDIRNNGNIHWAVNPQVAFNNAAGAILKKTTTAGTTQFTGGTLLNNDGIVDAQLGTIEIPGGTSSGTFQATLPGTVDFASATHTVNGATVQGNGVRLNGGTITGAGGLTIPSAATMTWSSGTMSGAGTTTINSGGTLNITGTVTHSQRIIDNFGLVVFSAAGGTINMGGAAVFNNKVGGIFDAQNAADSAIHWNVNPQVNFNNEGLFKKTTTAGGITRFTGGVLFNNTGTVDGQIGTIEIVGGASTGTFQATAPATVDFNTGTHTMNGASILGNGVRLNGGTLNGTALTIQSPAVMTWSSGTMSGVTTDVTNIALGGTLKITGNVQLSGRGISNSGSVIFASGGGTFNFGIGATFTNNASGVFDDQNTVDAAINWNINPQVFFVNNGTITKTAGPTATLRFAGGIALNNDGNVTPTIGTIDVANGTSTGLFQATLPAAVTFTTGTHNMNGGYVGGNGGVRLDGGTIAGPNFLIPNGAIFTWASGTMSGATTDATNIVTGGTMRITGSVFENARTINNTGTVIFVSNGGALNLGGGASFNNLSGGTFDDQNTVDTNINWLVNPQCFFNNAGLLKKSAGAAATTRFSGGLQLNNTGTVDGQVGTIEIANGTSTGLFTATSPAIVAFNTSTHTMNGGNAGGNGVRLNGGTINGTSFIINPGATFTWSSGTMGGAAGTDTTTVAGGGTMVINGVVQLNVRTINNNGLVNFTSSGATFNFGGGATFNNNATGVFDAQNATDTSIFWNINPPVAFNNAGLFRKTTTAAGKTIVSGVVMNNTGTIDAQLGTIALDNGTSTGSFTTSAGANVDFVGGTHTLNAGATLNGPGIRLVGATLTGTGINVASGGTLTWVSGAMNGPGQTTTITSGGKIVYAGSGTLNERTLSNDGTFVFLSGTAFNMGAGATFNNNASGLFDDQNTVNDQIVWVTNPPVAFNNAGIFRKSATAGTTTTLASGMPFNNTGTVDAQAGTIRIAVGTSSGAFNTAAGADIAFYSGTHTLTTGATFTGAGRALLAGGTLTSSQPITINGGTLGGNGTINANVVNNAIVAPGTSPGGLTINGNYTQSSGASLNIELAGTAPASTYDRLTVSGSVTLAGTLNVTLFGGYTPAGGEQYTPLLFGTRSGDFAVKNLPTFGSGGSFTSTYTATALRLDATVTNPDLSVAQTAPATVAQGQNVVFTITVTNGPTANTTNVVLTDTFSGAAFVSAVPSSGTCTGSGPVTCNLGTVPLNSSRTITLTLNANAAGTISNTASVTESEVDANTANNTSTKSVTVTSSADVTISKTAGGPAVAGQPINYTIVVTNNGPSAAANVVVADATPAGTTFLANSGACTTPFPCSLGTLNSGNAATIVATYVVSPSASGTVTNSATVSSSTPDPNGANQTASVTSPVTQSADLVITKSGPSTARPNTTIVYTINVTNAGPSDAFNVVVDDPTPSRLTFVSNSGACTTPYPCNLGALANAQLRTITSTYTVQLGTTSTISNTATVTSTTSDSNSGNNAALHRTTMSCPTAPSNLAPATGTATATSGSLSWTSATSATFNVYFGRALSGCSSQTPFATVTSRSISFSGLEEGAEYEWRVEAEAQGCPRVTSECQRFTVARSCNAIVPQLLTPQNNAVVSSPVTFSWTPSGNAGTVYTVFGGSGTGLLFTIGKTTSTSLVANVPDGPFTWGVSAEAPGCAAISSATGTFNTCNIPFAPRTSVIGQASSGQSYTVSWGGGDGAVFEVQEADNAEFAGAKTTTTDQTSLGFRLTANTSAVARYYRVRQKTRCASSFGPFSLPVRIVIVPLPQRGQGNPNVNVSAGSKELVVQQVFVPGEPGSSLITYTATVDKPWLSVRPSTGVLPTDGVTLDVIGDPSNLPNGTFTGTVLVTFDTVSASRIASKAGTVKGFPVSISLVTPVTPTALQQPPDHALIIPSTGHLDGLNSQWQSDVRVTNTSADAMRYQLTFTAAGANALSGVKQTFVDVAPGATIALDDIVRNWYGIGSLGDSANGVLAIHSVDSSGAPLVPSNSRVTVVSSRTYNATANGTLGQYIPAIPLASFIGRTSPNAAAQILSLQQIAQSNAFRTNVGIVEGSGKPASVNLSVFSAAGAKLAEARFDLAANEQKQLNGFLSTLGIKDLADGRVEAQVIGGDGRVTAYASVVDNGTNDPLLVSGSLLRATFAQRYVLAGVADLNTGLASWRTDMRVFNSGASDQSVTLTFHPQDNSAPRTATTIAKAGEVKTLDNVLQSVFGTTNNGGAVHVTTPASATLVVTGRTYNATANGTYGQFVPAVTVAEAVGGGERALEIQQLEDSPRFRTNIGFTEVSGKDAEVEVIVTRPDSRVSPRIVMTLPANSFRQMSLLRDLGLGNVYNARVSVKVIGGEGRVSAYGSVIDMLTQDPTYVPAQ
jgi:uncharacterized repeat protein (TIGR01451 family)